MLQARRPPLARTRRCCLAATRRCYLASSSLVSVHAISDASGQGRVCVCHRVPRSDPSPSISLSIHNIKGFLGFSRRCTGGRRGLILGLALNFVPKKKIEKNTINTTFSDPRELNQCLHTSVHLLSVSYGVRHHVKNDGIPRS